MEIHIGDRVAEVELISKEDNKVRATVDGKTYDVDIVIADNGVCSLIYNGQSYGPKHAVFLFFSRLRPVRQPCPWRGIPRIFCCCPFATVSLNKYSIYRASCAKATMRSILQVIVTG